MLVSYPTEHKKSYTPITSIDGPHSDMKMNFGLIAIAPGEPYVVHSRECETALLLLSGSVVFSYARRGKAHKTERATRASLTDENPCVLHVPANTEVTINAETACEIALQQAKNSVDFAPKFYGQTDITTVMLGEHILSGTSNRVVRTVFDAATAPDSAMVLGEVVNFPGRWSSYPPHNHPQPEVYHYRFFPEHGFGFGQSGEHVYKLTHKSTLMIQPWDLHPQCSAPGYVMYYIWMIPHVPEGKFGPESRRFVEPHVWLTKPGVDDHVWHYKRNS